MYLPYQETHCVDLDLPELRLRNVSVKILREDLNHEFVSGNKWWKLKHNLLQAKENRKPILTFGGAFSNHIYATAAATEILNIPSIGIVRGGPFSNPSPTLAFAQEKGMRLHYVSRENYQQRDSADTIDMFHRLFGDFLIVPEGGSNEAAVEGCAEWGKNLLSSFDFDVLCVPVGTGGTLAGLIRAFNGQRKIIGFSALKDDGFLVQKVQELCKSNFINWQIESGFHFGGYAKTKPVLLEFMKSLYAEKSIPLDAVYTSKALWGLLALIEKGRFDSGQKILFIHTGGLQGNLGFFSSMFPVALQNHHAKA